MASFLAKKEQIGKQEGNFLGYKQIAAELYKRTPRKNYKCIYGKLHPNTKQNTTSKTRTKKKVF